MRALLLLLACLPADAAPSRVRLAPPIPRLAPSAVVAPRLTQPAPTLTAPAPVPTFTPESFLSKLKQDPALSREYAKGVGVDEGYDLEKHTLMVMRQGERYLAHRMGPRRELFRAVLALHDIGKPRALAARNMTRQHEFTAPMMREELGKLGFSPEEVRLGGALVEGDPIGSFLKGGDPERAERTLRSMIESSGVPAREFVNLLLAVYMADASSYPKLGWLFNFDDDTGRMRFAPEVARRLAPFLHKVVESR